MVDKHNTTSSVASRDRPVRRSPERISPFEKLPDEHPLGRAFERELEFETERLEIDRELEEELRLAYGDADERFL